MLFSVLCYSTSSIISDIITIVYIVGELMFPLECSWMLVAAGSTLLVTKLDLVVEVTRSAHTFSIMQKLYVIDM